VHTTFGLLKILKAIKAFGLWNPIMIKTKIPAKPNVFDFFSIRDYIELNFIQSDKFEIFLFFHRFISNPQDLKYSE
jgi:hypothetical protein